MEPLGLPRPIEHDGSAQLVVGLQEGPTRLLEERRKEVRNGHAEPCCELHEPVLGQAGLGTRHPRKALDILDQSQSMVAVDRVVDHSPGREAKCLTTAGADLNRPAGQGKPEEPHSQVLGRAEGRRHKAHHHPFVECAVAEGACCDRVHLHGQGGVHQGVPGHGGWDDPAGFDEAFRLVAVHAADSSSLTLPA